MSEILTSFCSVLLKEYFGETVQKVGVFLLRQVSSCPLFVITRNVGLPADKVKSSLCVLIQHNFCTFTQEEKGFVEYTVKHDDVLHLLHYEHYAYCAQSLFGDTSDLLIEEILNKGKLTASVAVQKVSERLQDAKEETEADYSLEGVFKKFKLLVEHRFLIRCPYPHPSENKNIPNLCLPDKEKFAIPEINLHSLTDSSEEPTNKRRKVENADIGKYWRINFDRFANQFRDDAIISACTRAMDEKSSEIVKIILTKSNLSSRPSHQTSHTVSYYDIQRHFSDTNSQNLDAYLSNLCEGDKSFVSKADDRGNGIFVVNIAKILQRLVEDTIASVVQDRFGSKCARIFRILLAKKVLEPKQIEELAMLHPKDTKEYIFKMFAENFIISHDLSKGSDLSHGQIFYLLKVDLIQVCRMLLERCYQALFNLITCSETQTYENRHLLLKKQRIDAIVANMRLNGESEEQIEDVLQSITEPEEQLINKITFLTQKIDSSQVQIAEMISLFKTYLEYSVIK